MRVFTKCLICGLMLSVMAFVAGCGGGGGDDDNNGKHSDLANKKVTRENLEEFWALANIRLGTPTTTHDANETVYTYSGNYGGEMVSRYSYTFNGQQYNVSEFSQALSEFFQQNDANEFTLVRVQNNSGYYNDFSKDGKLFMDGNSSNNLVITSEYGENLKLISTTNEWTINGTINYSGEFRASLIFDNLKFIYYPNKQHISGKVSVRSGGNTFDITDWYLAKYYGI